MDASFFSGMMSILEQEPRLHNVLSIVSSNGEFDDSFKLNESESVSTTASVLEINGQATKGSRRIPWHTEATKDVVTCDKSRGAGSTL